MIENGITSGQAPHRISVKYETIRSIYNAISVHDNDRAIKILSELLDEGRRSQIQIAKRELYRRFKDAISCDDVDRANHYRELYNLLDTVHY